LGRAAAEKCQDTEKIECASKKPRVELEQVDKIQEYCRDLKLIPLLLWKTWNTSGYWSGVRKQGRGEEPMS